MCAFIFVHASTYVYVYIHILSIFIAHLDHCGQGQEVKDVGEMFPHVCAAVLAVALIVETIHLMH